MPCGRSAAWLSASWSYGVTASTLDSESSDRGSNPRRTLFNAGWACGLQSLYQHLGVAVCNVQGASRYLFSRPEERRGPNPCCLVACCAGGRCVGGRSPMKLVVVGRCLGSRAARALAKRTDMWTQKFRRMPWLRKCSHAGSGHRPINC